MKTVKLSVNKLKEHFPQIKWRNFEDVSIRDIRSDSRRVQKGDLYISVCGRHHGTGTNPKEYEYICDAIRRGASVVLAEESLDFAGKTVTGQVANAREILAKVASLHFGNPSLNLNVVGITGTNGKTTTSFLLRSIFEIAGFKTGLLGTICYRYGHYDFPAELTTPDPITLNKHLAQMVHMGISHAVMEVSSHALAQHRTAGIDFRAGIFTNMSAEHFDYHCSWEDYRASKSRLFESLNTEGHAVVNADDKNSQYFMENTSAQFVSYGIDKQEGISAHSIQQNGLGYKFTLQTLAESIEICLRLPGKYNIYNCLGAAGCALAMGISLKDIKKGLETIQCIPGRMEVVDCGQPFNVVVDYAHTPDALYKALKTLREFTANRVLLVFGCGGDRDSSKRLPMGKIACELADQVWITNDNPRTEDPEKIAQDIAQAFGVGKQFSICLDRNQAITEAIAVASNNDSILIAGKGHETMQIIGHTTYPFDDCEVAQKILQDHLTSVVY